MAWYDEAIFYHIYPLGLTGAPASNAYEGPDNPKEIGRASCRERV